MKIFVAGLPHDMDDAELEEFFEKFGKVDSVKIAIDRQTGKSRGFGFVEMPNILEAKEAIETLNDLGIGKKKLVVKEATNTPDQRDFRAPSNPRPANRYGSSYRPRDKY